MTDEEVKQSLIVLANLREECDVGQVLKVLADMAVNDTENFNLFVTFNFAITQYILYGLAQTEKLMDTGDMPEC